MDGVERAAAQLARQALVPLPFAPVFSPLVPSQERASPPRAVVAIDGSHAVLWDNGAIWVVAYRAAAVVHEAGPVAPVEPAVLAVPAADAQAAAEVAWAGCPHVPRVSNAESLAEALRGALELAAVERACQRHPGAMVLVDGALHGLPPHAAWASSRMQEAARTHGCDLIGVAKRSGLAREGVPLLPAIARISPAGCWAAPLPGTPGAFAARLHASSPHAFRVDVVEGGASRGQSRAAGDLARLLPLCRDAAYRGYPYPLAKAHNAVAITASEAASLRARLEAAVRRKGPDAWYVLADFHQVLDRGVPG